MLANAERSQTAATPIYAEERARVQRRVSGFDWRMSYAWGYLRHVFGPKLSQEELVSIAQFVATTLQIRLDRERPVIFQLRPAVFECSKLRVPAETVDDQKHLNMGTFS
jgi:hypothetical protein